MAKTKPNTGKKRKAAAGEWRAAFLATLRNTANVRQSCETAKVSRVTAYEHYNTDPEFKRQWDEAKEDACDLLEGIAFQRAGQGSDLLTIFLLKAHRRQVYGDRLATELTGKDGGPVETVISETTQKAMIDEAVRRVEDQRQKMKARNDAIQAQAQANGNGHLP